MQTEFDIATAVEAYSGLDLRRLGWYMGDHMISPDDHVPTIDVAANDPEDTQGLTAFFRKESAYENLIRCAMSSPKGNFTSILVVGSSIGADAITCSILADYIDPSRDVRIHQMDKSPAYTNIARVGIYPSWTLSTIPEWTPYFEISEGGYWAKPESSVAERITTHDAADILDFEPGQTFDLVIAMFVLQHLPREQISNFLAKLVSLSHGMVAFNGLMGGIVNGYVSEDQCLAMSERLAITGAQYMDENLRVRPIMLPLPTKSELGRRRHLDNAREAVLVEASITVLDCTNVSPVVH